MKVARPVRRAGRRNPPADNADRALRPDPYSRLCGPGPRDWFYLYVILVVFSLKIVGCCVETEETKTVAKRLITVTCNARTSRPASSPCTPTAARK